MSLNKTVAKFLPVTAALIPIVTGALFVSAEASQRWVRLVSDNNAALYIDAASIRGRRGYRYYWQQIVFSQPQVSNARLGGPRVQVQGYMLYSSVDCRTRNVRFRRALAFDRKGKVIVEVNMDNYGPLQSMRRTPSPDRFAADYACRRRR
jgi:hypothetical protein